MERVLLKSRKGPYQIRIRTREEDGIGYRYSKEEITWSLDNDCRASVPRWWWEENQDTWFDRKANVRMKEAFIPL